MLELAGKTPNPFFKMTRLRPRILLSLATLALVNPLGCEKRNDSPVGYGELEREISDPELLPIGFPSEDTSYSTLIAAGSSTSLLAGTFQGYEARTLLRFEISDTQVTNHATRAKLRLRRQKRLGTGSLDLSLCTLGEAWEEDWTTWIDADSATPWTAPGGWISDTIASATIAEVDSVSLTIPGSLVSSIISPSNNGLILISADNVMADFYSRHTSTPPLLFVHYFKGDSARVDTVVPLADAFIIHTDYEVPDARLVIGNGHVFRALLKFDLSPVPEKASINYGILELFVDPSQSSFEAMELAAHRVTGQWREGQTPFEAETNSMVSVAAEDSSIQIDIAPVLQDCVSGEDFGLLLKSTSELSDVSRVALFSSEADSSKRPNLVVFYTLPPGFR